MKPWEIPVVVDPDMPPGVIELRSGEDRTRAWAVEGVAAEIADQVRRRLAEVSRCQACGRSATGAGWDLLRHAQAMNYALGVIRFTVEAEARDGMVPAEAILRALDQPYRFPLPDAPQ